MVGSGLGKDRTVTVAGCAHVPVWIRAYGKGPSFRGVRREFRSPKQLPCRPRTEHLSP